MLECSVPSVGRSRLLFEPVGTPDPIVTANIYCSGRLSEVIVRVIGPFWQELRDLDEDRSVYIWLLRYAKGGEHLKVRLHGPVALEPEVRLLLRARAVAYLAALGPPEDDAARHSREIAAPIDREDSESGDRPDRTFLWTHYGRSVVSLGYKPLLDDEEYLARFTRCLGHGTELILDRLAAGEETTFSHAAAQATLLHAVIHGLAVLDFAPRRRGVYLLYHRDWLLRGVLKQSRYRASAEKMAQTLERFDARIESMAPAEDEVRRRATSIWRDNEAGAARTATRAWRKSVAELAGYVAQYRGNAAYDVDPFAEDPGDVPLFKVLHGLANQLGLAPLNEAFVYHFLHVATNGREKRHEPVRLRPA